MSEQPAKPGISLRAIMEQEKAKLLERQAQDAARVQVLDQKLEKLSEYEQLAAEFNFDLVAKSVVLTPHHSPAHRESAKAVVGITLGDLIETFLTDPRSSFQNLQFQTREDARAAHERIKRQFGHLYLSAIGKPDLEGFYDGWSAGGIKLAIGHALMGRLRTVLTFGATILEDTECQRLSGVYQTLHFEAPKARAVRLTADQANSICSVANKRGLKSIALVQAFQFETDLRQRDVIGQWVPIDEPNTLSEIISSRGEKMKWIRGLRWSHIDSELILTYEMSTRQKTITVDLKTLPMVRRELLWVNDRSAFPASGPVIVSESSGLPYRTEDFRKKWRRMADLAGVPRTVRNMDNMRSDTSDGDAVETESDEDDRQVG
jgi:hypothetical protein